MVCFQCSLDVMIRMELPHISIEEIVEWLEVGFSAFCIESVKTMQAKREMSDASKCGGGVMKQLRTEEEDKIGGCTSCKCQTAGQHCFFFSGTRGKEPRNKMKDLSYAWEEVAMT